MSRVAIIGLGTVGSYLVYKLKKMGIKVSAYDIRAGVYNRPGYVNYEDMEK